MSNNSKPKILYSVVAFGYLTDMLHRNKRVRVRQGARLHATNIEDAQQALLDCYPNINNWLEVGFVVSPVSELGKRR